MESKDILNVLLNNVDNNHLLEYFDMIQTPFNDFGILYKNPIKLSWVLEENKIDNFESLEIHFLNVYLNEENMDLMKHFIKLNNEDLDEIIISKRMEYILLKELNN